MFKKIDKSEETTWLSLSDMMTVLMVLFMILANIYSLNATKISKVIGVVDTL